jgi:hypothetical protein
LSKLGPNVSQNVALKSQRKWYFLKRDEKYGDSRGTYRWKL